MPRDPLVDEYRDILRDERNDVATGAALDQRNSADIARARRMARLAGTTASIAQAEPKSIAAGVHRIETMDALDADPQLAHFLADPDNAALARNDMHRLAAVGSLLQPWTSDQRDDYLRSIGVRPINNLGEQARAGVAQLIHAQPSGLLDRHVTPAEAAVRPHTPLPEPVNWSMERGISGAARLFGETGLRTLESAFGLARMYTEATQPLVLANPYFTSQANTVDVALRGAADAVHPGWLSPLQEDIYSGLSSGAQFLAFGAAGESAALWGLTGATTGEAYGRYRGRNATVGEASAGALFEGAVENLTERLPIHYLFNRFGTTGAKRWLAGFAVSELGGEQVATLLQDAADASIANPNMTWAQWEANIGPHARSTLLATLMMAAVVGGSGALAMRLRPQAQALDDISQGLAGQNLLDNLMTEASQSEVRKLDAQSFSDFVTSRADGSPVSHVYLPIEAVDTYLQSEGADTEFFRPYAQQIGEARRLNGDVVVPIGEALAHLAGTPVWTALREEARVTPGGMSGREATERAKTFLQELEDRGAEIAKEAEAASVELAPVTAIYERTKAALTALKRTPQEAEAVAQIFAARRETAAARLGQTVEEYDKAHPVTFRNAAKGEKAAEDVVLIDSASLRASGSTDLKALGSAVEAAVNDALVQGGKVSLIIEGKSRKIVGPGLRDSKGQQWGILPLMQPTSGDHARVEILTGRTLFQDKSRIARGSTKFYENRPDAIITLFKTANFSTLVHELGHVFLEEMLADAATEAAPQELKDDAARIAEWFKANGHPVKGGKIPIEAHELWARGFERYVMEGKAPSEGLRGAFAKFAEWLSKIYESVRALRSPITPEIREVMDRMLATREAIDANQETTAHFVDRAKVDMTDAEWEAYQASILGARNAAYDELLGKTMAAIRRREQARFREQRETIKGEVAAEINDRPEFVALHLLRTGRWLNDAEREGVEVKLNSGWLIDTYGEDIASRLPRGLPIMRGDGRTGDAVAELVGLPSGDALVKALIAIREQTDKLRASGDSRSFKETLIEAETDRRMARRHGDAMTDGSIEEEAVAAINSARQGEIIAGELRQLRRQKPALGGPTPYQIAREWARRKIVAERIVDVASRAAVQRYTRATAKAARAFEEASLKDDVDEAFRQKQAQLLNHALLAESKKAADQVEEIVARMQRYARQKARKSIDQDYFDRVHELLERFDFRARSQASIDEKNNFETWAARRQAEGFEVLVPPRLAAIGEHYSRVSMSDLIELDDAISSLMALGWLKQKMRDGKEERDFNEWRDTARANILALPERKLGDNPSDEKKRRFVALGVGGLKIEEIAGELDLDDPNGPFNNLLVKRATEAANHKVTAGEEIINPIVKMYFGMSGEMRRWLGEKVTSDHLTWNVVNEGDPRIGSPVTLTRMEWIGVAMNIGNISNLEKMTKGERWSAPGVQRELNRILDKKEAWDFAQFLWQQADRLWPAIVENERQMSGVVPERVEALDIETPFGTYKGGYWPAVADVGRSQRAANNEADAANDLFGYRSGIGTPKGHTIARTEATYPMSYRLEEILFTHLDRVTTRNAYAVWARDVLRVVDNATIAGAIKTRLGREYLDQIKPWLRRQINGNLVDKRGSAEFDKYMRGFRVNMSLAVMGLSYSTAQAQALGLGQSAARIGAKWVGVGFREMLKNPTGMRDYVYERSPEMARRGREVNREMSEFFKALKIQHGKFATVKRWYRNAQTAAFWHIAWMDRWSVSLPTWLGAYHKGLTEGMTDEEASAYGDKIVRMSQGSGREKDLSAWQSPNAEANRFWTMFYTPFNVALNQQWKSVRMAKRGNWRGAAQMQVWLLLAIALGDALQGGDWPTDEEGNYTVEGFAKWFARNIFFSLWSGIPVARDAANVTERHITGQYAEMQTPISALYAAVERAVSEGRQVGEGEQPVNSETIRAEASALGYLSGLPGNQIGKTGGFLYDTYTGDAQPETIADWYRGLTYGRLPAQ